MNNKVLVLSIIAVIISFIGGFILANGLNRSEMDKLRAEIASLQKSPKTNRETADSNQNNSDDISLSDQEIKEKIAEADRSPKDFEFQKKLGVSLYKYAAMKRDNALLTEAERILNRANQLTADDYEVIVALGNLNFDLGFFNDQYDRFEKARKYYESALTRKPDDVEVRTEIGMTYLLQNPSDAKKAISELQKSLEKDPQHEKSLYFLTQAFLKEGNETEAEKTLGKLKEINPQAPQLEEIRNQLKQGNK
ncbi:MAG: tetratricopeptide repeat protein [Pyrinomonadaceae bacterium]|nr:tetratricopeptide repeat protein [Pyrinomonadaceae bacterium]